VTDEARRSPVSLEGAIVEIIESGGASSLRLGLQHMIVLNLAPDLVDDLHLGDRIAIDGELRVDRVHALPDLEPAAAPRPPGGPR
jgi:hypothetical protein